MRLCTLSVAALLSAVAAFADEHQPVTETIIESNGRSVTFNDQIKREHTGYDSPWHYAHAVRAGDYVHISGVIIAARQNDTLPLTRERFREEAERTFKIIQRFLATANADLSEVVKINTFHVLDGKVTELDIAEQALVIAEVREQYIVEPYSAWTAVGTTGLFSPRGIVEIEMVVYSPQDGE